MNPYNISIATITHNNNNSKYIQVSKSSAAPRIPSFQHSILAHIPVRIPDISPFLHSRASDHSQYTAHTTTAVKPAAPITTSIRSGQQVKSEINPYNISITIFTHNNNNNNNSKYIQVSKFSAAPRIPSFQHSILAHIPVRIPDISPFLHSRASDHSQYTAHTTMAGKPAAPIPTSIHSGQQQVYPKKRVRIGEYLR